MAGKSRNPNPRVKNKSAIQILREAQEPELKASKQQITDPTELSDYRLRKRNEFEDLIRRAQSNKGNWVKYAKWEESQNDFNRARSVWDRALEVHYRDYTIWVKYAEFEMRNKFIDEARDIWDRGVNLLPRVDQLWCKYANMEEVLGNVEGARRVFDRWMKWEPDQEGWLSYVEFELRCNEVERCREVFERFVICHPEVGSWIRFVEFEIKNGEIARAKKVYERAFDNEFEVSCKEGACRYLCRKVVGFEKEGIEDDVVGKRRVEYEEEVRKNPLNYEGWFDYVRLEESVCNNKERVRDVYERAISNVPPCQEKRYWERYIYLWINYALFEEEGDCMDRKRVRDIYKECLSVIPHDKFSFAKVWLLAAEFEIRELNLKGARKILGEAIGRAPKDKIFNKYIAIELQLGNIDRCRRLYEKYLEWSPENCNIWIKYAELERAVGETDRSRAIFEVAIEQPTLDMPDLLWKAYIDMEISGSKFEKVRALYERLLNRTKHLNVWISYAKFEASAMAHQAAREVFERGLSHYLSPAPELKEGRKILLVEWLNMESSLGDSGDVELVKVKQPNNLKRKLPFTDF